MEQGVAGLHQDRFFFRIVVISAQPQIGAATGKIRKRPRYQGMMQIVLMAMPLTLRHKRPMAAFSDQPVETEGVPDLQNRLIGVQRLHHIDEPSIGLCMGGDKGIGEE